MDSLTVIDKLVTYYNDERDGSVGQRVGTGNGPSVNVQGSSPGFLVYIIGNTIPHDGTCSFRYEDKKIFSWRG